MAHPSNEASARRDSVTSETQPLLGRSTSSTVRKGEKIRDCCDRLEGSLDALTPRKKGDINDEGTRDGTYDTGPLITIGVFFHVSGTVLTNMTLWKETITSFSVYLLVAIGLAQVRWTGFAHFVGKESTIRAFLSMFSNLIGILIAFYTSMVIGRWWAMRQGMQAMVMAASRLTVLLAHGVSSDPDLLSAINRYTRCSIFLVFAEAQTLEDPISMMVQREILTQEEAHQLAKLEHVGRHSLAGVPWAWLNNAITLVNKQGLSMGPPHFCAMLLAVESGRSGLTQIQTYMETAIPQSYLHILGLLVKLHNVLMAALYALICVMHLEDEQAEVAMFRTAFRSFFMPFLYNALLIINQDLTNPFSGDVNDIPYQIFDVGIMQETDAIREGATIKPEWMKDRKYEPWTP